MKNQMRLNILIVSLLAIFTSTGLAAEPTFTQLVSYNGETITMQMTKVNLRGPNFELWVYNSEGEYDPNTPVAERSYLGTVEEYPGAISCGVLFDNGDFMGAVYFDRGVTWFTSNGTVTKTRGLEYAVDTFIGYSSPSAPSVAPGQAGTNMYGFDVGIDAHYSYYSVRGGSDIAHTFELIEYSVICTSAIYMRDTMLRPYLGRVIIRADLTYDPFIGMRFGDYLSGLRTHWNGNHTDADRDVVAGVGRGMAGGGLAWVGVIGTSSAYSINDADADGNFSIVWRHELGHNWGLNHFMGWLPEGKGIMGGNIPGRFSGCEVYGIMSHRDSRLGILDNEGAYDEVDIPPYAAYEMLNYEALGYYAGDTITIDVLANDHDANGDTLSIQSVDATSNLGGSVQISAGTGPGGRDEVTYTSLTTSSNDTDWFLYTIVDSSGQTATGVEVIWLRPRVSPDPAGFATSPYASSMTSMRMVATTATSVDAGGVEYYFTSVDGPGNDSDWQDSPVYEDTGLVSGMIYAYTVTARAKTPSQYTTRASMPGFDLLANSGGTVVLSDDFEDGVLDPNDWQSINGTVTETGGSVVYPGGEYLVTKAQWQPTAQAPLMITGSCTLGYAGGHFSLWSRSADFIGSWPTVSCPDTGLRANFWAAGPPTYHSPNILEKSAGIEWTSITQTGQQDPTDPSALNWNFEIIDNGTTISFTVWETGKPWNSGYYTGTSSTVFSDNHIALAVNSGSLHNVQISQTTPPAWSSDPVTEMDAYVFFNHSSTLNNNVTHGPAVFTKLSGPAWLTVASDGTLDGTPGESDEGLNSWVVSVSNGLSTPVEATLNITVVNAVLLSDDFEDGVLDPNDWQSINGTVTESGGSAVYSNSEYLVTQLQWQPTAQAPLLITGSLTLGSGDDYFSIWSRSADFIGSWATVSCPDTGLRANFWAPGPSQGYHSPNILEKPTGAAWTSVTITQTGQQNPTNSSVLNWNFELFDNGTNISFKVWETGNPSNLGYYTGSTSTLFSDNHIAISVSSGRLHDVLISRADPPAWISNPVAEIDAYADFSYSSTLTDDVAYGAGIFEKVSGPNWLTVASDGTLSGTPGDSNAGLNSWVVSVGNGVSAPVETTLNITVVGAVLLYDDFEDGVLDTSKWKSINGTVTESGGSAVCSGNEYLVTQAQWQPTTQAPLKITGSLTLGYVGGSFSLWSRSADFIGAWPTVTCPDAGLRATFWAAGPPAYASTSILEKPASVGWSVITQTGQQDPASVNALNWDFELIDDGTNISLTVWETGNPSNTGYYTGTSSTVFSDNHIAMILSSGSLHEIEIRRVNFINLKDFANLALNWQATNCGYCSGADLDANEQVNMADLLIMTELWLQP